MKSIFIKKPLSFSLITLILANFFPIIGVLFLDWSVFSVLFIYWLESGVIGFYNILKMLFSAKNSFFVENFIENNTLKTLLSIPRKIFYIMFFMFHYGMFMLVHGIFIFFMFGLAPKTEQLTLSLGKAVVSFLSINNLIIALSLLFISHGVSYFSNFIGKKEFQKFSINQLFFQPYKRIIIMHLVIIFGGIGTFLIGIPPFAVILLILLKIIFDSRGHIKEHSVLGI